MVNWTMVVGERERGHLDNWKSLYDLPLLYINEQNLDTVT